MRGVINNPYLVGNSIIMKKTKLSKIVKGGIPAVLAPAGIMSATLLSGGTVTMGLLLAKIGEEGVKRIAGSIGEYVGAKVKEYELDNFFSEELTRELKKVYGDNSYYIIEVFENSANEFMKNGIFVDEGDFCKIFREEVNKIYKEDIPLEDGIEKEIYQIVTDKFEILAKEIAKKDQKEFRKRVIDELEKNGIKVDEIYKILTRVRIPTIEDKHKLDKYKDEYKKSELFRGAGPKWIDFEKGFVVERKNKINEIIEKFKDQNIVIMIGKPASGKTVISRNIGYKLANEGKDVYVLELPWDQRSIEEILKLDDFAQKSDVYFLVDSAHLDLTLLHNIIGGLKSVKILISMRDINVDMQISTTSGSVVPYYLKENREKYVLEVKSMNVREGIIKKFEAVNEIKIIDGIKQKLNKKSLWILAWELETYKRHEGACKKHKKIDETEFYDTVAKHIKYIGKEVPLELKVNKPEDVILPLSVFYKYEISIRREFIEQFADENDIENMIRLNEIHEYEDEKKTKYLTLHHSDAANVFIKTFQRFDEFGGGVKKKIDKTPGENWFEKFFYLYIRYPQFSNECLDVILKLCFYSQESELIKKLINNNFDEIIVCIKEENIGKIGLLLTFISGVSKELAEKLLDSLDLESLKSGINIECEDIIDVVIFMEGVEWVNKELAEKLVKSLDLDGLKGKIEDEDDVLKLTLTIGSISGRSNKVAERLLKSLDLEKLKVKIDAEKDVGKIGFSINIIGLLSSEFAERLLKSLDLEKLKVKIDAEEDIRKINLCIGQITRLSIEVAEQLIRSVDLKRLNSKKDSVNNLIYNFGFRELNEMVEGASELLKRFDLETLKNRVSEEGNILKTLGFIAIISNEDEKIAEELVRSLNTKKLSDKINAEKNSIVISECIILIAKFNKELAYELIPVLKDKLDIEKDVGKIGLCIGRIDSSSKEVANRLVNIMDLEILKDKIIREKSILKITWVIRSIACVNKEVAEKLIKSMDLEILK